MKTFTKTIVAALFAASLISVSASAQSSKDQVKQETLDWKNLRVQPTLSIYIPYVDLAETSITANLNIEAAYNLPNLADVHAGLHVGSFQGISAGGTLHLHEKMVNKPTKFKVATTTRGNTETNSFYRADSEYRSITGPTAHVRVGKFGDSGFYMRIDGGLDRQTQSHAYYKGYASNRNGFTSMKLMGTVAKFNQSEMVTLGNEEYVSRIGAGGLFSLLHERRPWKRITWNVGIEMGYMVIFGVNNFTEGVVDIENNKSNYILEMKGGFSIAI